MQANDSTDMFDSLKQLLEEEYVLLLAGELLAVGELVPQKEALLTQVEQQKNAETPALVELRNMLFKNGKMLDAALAGLRSAANRISGRAVQSGRLRVYDRAGRSSDLQAVQAPIIEKSI